ncbi:hypothetical protein [Vibrio harveyi]
MMYVFRYCPNCGTKAQNKNNQCHVCGDMWKACLKESKPSSTASLFKVFLAAILILFGMLFFGDLSNGSNANQAQQKESEQVYFDFDLGKEKYANWIKDNGAYRTDFLNMSAFIERTGYGAKVVFIEPSSTCTESQDSGFEQSLQFRSDAIKRSPVKFVKHCYSRGWVAYTPYDEKENEIVVNAFKESDDVLVNGMWDDAIFSGLGFTDAYTFMSQ